MARQKLPQQIDDCIKCTLPEDGSYRHCMNCRNKAVEECRRLEDELSSVRNGESSKESSVLNLCSVNVSDFANKCGSCVNLGAWVGSGFDEEDMHMCTQLGATTYVNGSCEYYEKAK